MRNPLDSWASKAVQRAVEQEGQGKSIQTFVVLALFIGYALGLCRNDWATLLMLAATVVALIRIHR